MQSIVSATGSSAATLSLPQWNTRSLDMFTHIPALRLVSEDNLEELVHGSVNEIVVLGLLGGFELRDGLCADIT